jgi:small subunit ribosomal protein S21
MLNSSKNCKHLWKVVMLMPAVTVRQNESIDKAIRRFKKECEKEGIVQEIKRASRFVKPSERRRKKALKAEKRRRSSEGRR